MIEPVRRQRAKAEHESGEKDSAVRRSARFEPNLKFIAAREAIPSRVSPGYCMSRAELAEAVHLYLWEKTKKKYDSMDANAIGKYERGEVRWPTARYREAFREILDASNDLDLGFYPKSRGNTAPQGEIKQLAESFESLHSRLNGTAERLITPQSEVISESAQSVEVTLLAASDESANFLAWAENTNVGDLTIDQIHGEIRRISRSYLKVPTMPLFERTRKLRDRVFGLLAGHQKPSQSRDLYSAAGWSLTVLAWMSTDLGHPDLAEEHLRTAWLCAENADQDNLRAWVCATQHTASFWQEDYVTAAQCAETGLSYANSGTTELFLASALALDLARSGEHERAQLVLLRAQNAADSITHHSVDELAGPFTCTVGRAGGFWSDTNLALGNAESALAYANDGVSAFESAPVDLRNLGSERMVRCQQVKAHIMLDEFDGAAEALQPILDTEPEHRVGPLTKRVREIMTMATRSDRADTPIMRQMREATKEFQRKQQPNSLPS